MSRLYLCLIVVFLFNDLADLAQPYFPSEIVFSLDDGETIVAIDETNQRAFRSIPYTPTVQQVSYVMQHFPYAVPDSPQSKHYVQLIVDTDGNCQYGTYWKYGEHNFNNFPSHWWSNITSFQVQNYLHFQYEMIYSNDSTDDEDIWYSNVTCRISVREMAACEEVHFKKNTEIPLRFIQVVRRGPNLVRVTTNYQVISIGQPDDKYFQSIPKNWFNACRDVNLALAYSPTSTTISLNQSSEIHLSLRCSTTSHRWK